jgi:hypothetical protein
MSELNGQRVGLQQAIANIDLYFQSGNDIPVERATIPAAAWEQLRAALAPRAQCEDLDDMAERVTQAAISRAFPATRVERHMKRDEFGAYVTAAFRIGYEQAGKEVQ